MGSRRAGSVDEEAKLGDKHQVLLQEYLVLQKVSPFCFFAFNLALIAPFFLF